MRPVPVLFVTYNRLEYSKKAFKAMIDNAGVPIRVTVWDNGSTEPGFNQWLDSIIHSANLGILSEVEQVIVKEKNVGLAPAMNEFFRQNVDEPYVAKVDNDTVLPENWLADLVEVMDYFRSGNGRSLVNGQFGAVSGTCLRPNGLTFKEWVRTSMKTWRYKDHSAHFNTYILGTGVLINMDMIRERGLLFEKFPGSPESGPDDPCLISGWTAYTREASEFEGWKFAFYSKVPVRLLNIREEHVLSNDYPEYDAEIAKVREEGNAWWESVGGLPGVRKYVQEHGGLERLYIGTHAVCDGLRPSVWTEADDLQQRSTYAYWSERVAVHGTTASTFLTTPQVRINEFTERHMEILHDYVRGRDVLEVGCGWGRMALPIAKLSKSYIGVDFVPELIEKARESMPDMDFRVGPATALPFGDDRFDLVIAITCLSSFAAILDDIVKECKRVLRPHGRILFLEETFARIDWKMEN